MVRFLSRQTRRSFWPPCLTSPCRNRFISSRSSQNAPSEFQPKAASSREPFFFAGGRPRAAGRLRAATAPRAQPRSTRRPAGR
eukprot:9345582-Heterocapsa_arctica.AAC.1